MPEPEAVAWHSRHFSFGDSRREVMKKQAIWCVFWFGIEG